MVASLKATLILEDGTIFPGTAIGATGYAAGEMVFNTAMRGYQEILTDPSYAGQMITFTCPHMGNVGVNPEDMESHKVWARGMICHSFTQTPSNWRATQSLDAFLKDHNVVGITDIDTRALVHRICNQGSLHGCIISDGLPLDQAMPLIQNGKQNTIDLMQTVSTKSKYTMAAVQPKYHIVVYDFGVKRSILTTLQNLGCTIMVVPWNTPAQDVLYLQADGIVLSNGPGDPSQCTQAIQATKIFLDHSIPIFGICLGHQILALACGATIFKMPFGHRGSNHPVLDVQTRQVHITSQNHGYAVEQSTLPECLEVTHVSLFDQTIQGIRHRSALAMGLQGHPEASPGPHDMGEIFQQFIELMNHASSSPSPPR
jgi:carbamoyl-phosphate synthase small subunit